MAYPRWFFAVLVGLFGWGEVRAQFVVVNPYGYSSVTYNRGFGYRYRRHHLVISAFANSSYTIGSTGLGYCGPAFHGYSGGGIAINRTIIVQPPPTVIVNPVRGGADEDEVAGIDLDVIDPHTMKPRRQALARKDEGEMPRRPLAERAPEGRRPLRPPPFQAVPRDEEEDLDAMAAGKKAFARREYGLAAQHFGLAVVAAPRAFLPRFLLAQAQFALGKNRDAAQAIRTGMGLKQDAPRADFQARALYRANEIEFLGHLKRLEDLLEKRPDDPELLFVLGFELWFDGQRVKAWRLFEKAKKFAADPAFIDPFLKAADVGPVAAR